MVKKQIIRVWEKGYPKNVIMKGKRKTGNLTLDRWAKEGKK